MRNGSHTRTSVIELLLRSLRDIRKELTMPCEWPTLDVNQEDEEEQISDPSGDEGKNRL